MDFKIARNGLLISGREDEEHSFVSLPNPGKVVIIEVETQCVIIEVNWETN